MLDLRPDRIHLWFTHFDQIRKDDLLARYRVLLSEEERLKEQRLYFTKNRHRYLVTRALVRTVLSRYAPIAPEQWTFTQNAYGKPSISNIDPAAKRISFNLSHTNGLIVLGVTCGGALGIDTENVCVRPARLGGANAFFSSEESRAISQLPLDKQRLRTFQCWTLKESYIKARGMGLSIPLDKFSFHFHGDARVRLSIQEQLKDEPSRWHFWQLRTSDSYLTSVCAERCGTGAKQLLLKRFVPLGQEQIFSCAPVLESDLQEGLGC